MRLSEIITIYLAAGASFGVSRYLCASSRSESRRRAAAEGIAATLFWPLMAAAILTKHLRLVEEDAYEPDVPVHVRIEVARRDFLASVHKMLDAVRASRTEERDALEPTLYALRESAEQYAGLAEIKAEVEDDAAPAAFEMELARISGRLGDDLLVAGRCAHRRNVRRIQAHCARERSRLLQKLSRLRAVEEGSLTLNPDTSGAERRKMCEARLEIYLRAAALFSLLEDEGAALSARKLADAERSLQRRQGDMNREGAATHAPGDERCTEHVPKLIYKDPLRETTFTQG